MWCKGGGESPAALDWGDGGILSGEVEQEQQWWCVDDGGPTVWPSDSSSSEQRARGPSSFERRALAGLPSGSPCGGGAWMSARGDGGSSSQRRAPTVAAAVVVASRLGAAKCRASEKWARVGCGRSHTCRYLANL
jgi:hypothetical protein